MVMNTWSETFVVASVKVGEGNWPKAAAAKRNKGMSRTNPIILILQRTRYNSPQAFLLKIDSIPQMSITGTVAIASPK